jgi:glycerol-3-phosphate cytidylyltransferase
MGTVGFTCSAFDLLHAGHILMLRDAKAQCDHLVVGLQVDPSVDRPTKNQPVQSLSERMIQLAAVRYVDEIVCYQTEEELIMLLCALNPDVRVLGDEYKGKPYTGQSLNIPIHWHQRWHSWSTSTLRRRVYSAERKKDETHSSR